MTLYVSDYDDEPLEEDEEELDEKEAGEEDEEEEEQRFFNIEYKCEDCDYLWREKQKADLSDDRSDDERWVIDDSKTLCPICGSSNITRM